MKDERLRVLKVMSEITSRVGLTEFAQMVNLTPNETLEQVQELIKTGHVRSSGNGYGITAKGKAVLKAAAPVADGLEFRFYSGLGQPTGLSARSLKEFYEAVKTIDAASLDFHLYRGDFKNWVQAVLGEAFLAIELESLSHGELRGENLREKLALVIESSYGEALG